MVLAKTEEKLKAEAERKATEVAVKVAVQSLHDAQTNSVGAEKADQDMIADIKGQLYRFYIAWNVWDPPDVGGIASMHVHSVDTLNALLRDKYHGTDLTWTPEQIGQHMLSISSLSEGISSPPSLCPSLSPTLKAQTNGQSPPKAKSETERVDELAASLKVFYETWGVERKSEQLKALASEYKDKQEVLMHILQDKYHGTDMSWSGVRLSATVKSVQREEAEVAAHKQREAKEAEEAAHKLEAQKLEKKIVQQEDADERARIDASLRTFYTCWSSSRSDVDIASLALQYRQDPKGFNAKLRAKYHGTDISWNEKDILAKRRQQGKEEEEAAQRQKAEEVAAAKKRKEEEDAASKTRERFLFSLVGKLKDFYSIWGAACSDDEVRENAMQYADDVSTLQNQLRITFHGTDLDWTRERLMAKKAQVEAAAEAKKKAEIEVEKKKLAQKLALEHLTANLMQFYAAWDTGRNSQNVGSVVKLHKKDTRALTFWEMFTVRDKAECNALAGKYLNDVPTLSRKLRERYSGTDLSTALSDIVQLKRKSDQEKEAAAIAKKEAQAAEAAAKKQAREEAEAAAVQAANKREEEAAKEARRNEELAQEQEAQRRAQEAARRERELAMIQKLKIFYGAWELNKSDAEFHRIATDYAGRQTELNQILQGRYSGSDLTWTHEQICALVARERDKKVREKELESERIESERIESEQESERIETEMQCLGLVTKLRVFCMAWGANSDHGWEHLALD